MNTYIKTLKEIVDDQLLTPSERYLKLINYINKMYSLLSQVENKKENKEKNK